MKKTVVVAGAAAAFLVLAPGAALAATTPTATPQPASEHAGVPKAYLRVLPKVARPGGKVEIRLGCAAESTEGLTSPALTISSLRRTGPQITPRRRRPPSRPRSSSRSSRASTRCRSPAAARRSARSSPCWVPRPPKQVAKVPAGAPQTGGTDGPVDGSGAPLAAAAAMGVLAVGGSGLVLARRARRR